MYHKSIFRSIFTIGLVASIIVGCQLLKPSGSGLHSGITPADPDPALVALTDSLSQELNWPDNLQINVFSGPDLTPSPAVISTAPTGEVFVGVDMQGSLGKNMDRGAILRLVDVNRDGVMDSYTEFARVDNPRGLIAMGNQVFVLYTTFSAEDSLATGQDLVVFEDLDGDGVADGPAVTLIENIGNPAYLQSRGTDHATNGIRLGIDGWIYIAVGDFGYANAVGRDGTELNMLGGGIVRIRPDGSEMEEYTHGTRNIYDVAIDPYLNLFSRDNTNDGGGWNTRFLHHIQSGQHGYPILFLHYTDEIIPALTDYGGGSGTGAFYMDDDRWPAAYNDRPLTADWGRSYLYLHELTPDGGSFLEEQEEMIELPQITDLDMDASGVLYLSAWDGAGFRGNPDRGYTVRVVPEGMEPEEFPNLENASIEELQEYLKSGSATARQYAQYELLNRPGMEAAEASWEVASDQGLPLRNRVAGIFTYAQISGASGIENLVSLTEDPDVREFALRAMTDRKGSISQVPIDPYLAALHDPSDRVKIAAIVGLGRMDRSEAVSALLDVSLPDSFRAPETGTEGPHATPNGEILPAHVAANSLVQIGDTDALLDAVESDQNELALWALRSIHEPDVAERLVEIYNESSDGEWRDLLLENLARIYHKEADYDATWWWGTRPDTHGPYYVAEEWEGTPLIHDFLLGVWQETPEMERDRFAELNNKYRLEISQFAEPEESEEGEGGPVVNLEEIQNMEGQVGESSYEDILIALENREGDTERGRELFVQQGCQACHTVSADEPLKGPYLGQIGGVMNREQILESILRPNASISQGFATVLITAGDNQTFIGFVSAETANELVLTDISGQSRTLQKSGIQSRTQLEYSMMPEGLVNALSYDELAAMVDYLSGLTQ